METLRYTAPEADRYLAEGNAGVAELLSFAALSQHPLDAAAWSVRARLARAIGETYTADRLALVATALTLDAPIPSPAPSPVPPGPAPDPNRFLLIKSWGYGFCSDLDHVLGCLLLAEMTGRTPVTAWGPHSLFTIGEPGADAFREYLEPVSPVSARDLIGKSHDFWPAKWNEANLLDEPVSKHDGPGARLSGLACLNRPERVLVSDYHTGVSMLARWLRPGHPAFGQSTEGVLRYLLTKYIRPAPRIREQVEQFAERHFAGSRVIAAHARGTDKFIEDKEHAQRLATIPAAIDHLAAGDRSAKIFLMTDSTPLIAQYQKRYGPRLVMTDAVRSSTRIGVQHMGLRDKRRLGEDIVRDLFLAARADRFVGLGSSNVACTIYHMKDWPPGSTVILGPLMNHMMDPAQFMTVPQLERYFPAQQIAQWRKEWR